MNLPVSSHDDLDSVPELIGRAEALLMSTPSGTSDENPPPPTGGRTAGPSKAETQGGPRYDNRVAIVQGHAKAGLLVAVAFVVAAAVASAASTDDRWLALHLFVVGALGTAISATTQLLAVTWSAAPAPDDKVVRSQLVLFAAGTACIAVGRQSSLDGLTIIGGVGVVAALSVLIIILGNIRRSSATDRFAPAIDAYMTAAVCGMCGAAVGTLMATAHIDVDWIVRIARAHAALNVFGFVGLVIAGTLPYFVATQARMKMSPRATPQRLRQANGLLFVAVMITVVGHGIDMGWVAAVGYGAYAAGLGFVASLLPRPGRRQYDWAGPRLLQLGLGLIWWIGVTVARATSVVRGVDADTSLIEPLVIGGYAQILIGSLAYFGPVLRAGGHKRLSAGFAVTRSWASLVGLNIAAVGAVIGSGPLVAAALLVCTLDVVVRTGRLLIPASASSST